MSLAVLADQMASKGRNGDSMLVHMSPEEVAGLHSLALAKGTRLTINPETGLVEAFGLKDILKSVLPAVAGFALGPAGFGLMTLSQAGLTVGAVTGLATGSLQKGIVAGLGAYGGANLGNAFSQAGMATSQAALGQAAAQEAAQKGLTDAAASEFIQKQVAEQAAKLTPFDTFKAGITGLAEKAGRDNLLAAAGGAGNLLKAGYMAALPTMADQSVQTTTQMPGKTYQGMIRPYTFDPYTRQWTEQTPYPAGTAQGPGMKSGGIVALADGGFTDEQIANAIKTSLKQGFGAQETLNKGATFAGVTQEQLNRAAEALRQSGYTDLTAPTLSSQAPAQQPSAQQPPATPTAQTSPGGLAGLAQAQTQAAQATTPAANWLNTSLSSLTAQTGNDYQGALAQKALASNPQIADMLNKVKSIDPTYQLKISDILGLEGQLGSGIASNDVFGNFLKQQQNVTSMAQGAPMSMSNPQYAAYQQSINALAPIASDKDFSSTTQKYFQKPPVAIWRDPTSGKGIAVQMHPDQERISTLTYLDAAGNALNSSAFYAPDLLKNAEKYGINLSNIGELGKQLEAKGVSYKPYEQAPGTGSDQGIDFNDIARGGIGTAYDWTKDPSVAQKGPTAAQRLVENQALFERLGLTKNPNVTTGGGVDPSKFAPLSARGEESPRKYVATNGESASWHATPEEAQQAATQMRGQVVDLTKRSAEPVKVSSPAATQVVSGAAGAAPSATAGIASLPGSMTLQQYAALDRFTPEQLGTVGMYSQEQQHQLALAEARKGLMAGMTDQQAADYINQKYGKNFTAQNVADFLKANQLSRSTAAPTITYTEPTAKSFDVPTTRKIVSDYIEGGGRVGPPDISTVLPNERLYTQNTVYQGLLDYLKQNPNALAGDVNALAQRLGVPESQLRAAINEYRFSSMTGGSKSAYDYLMGRGEYPVKPYVPGGGPIMRPYAEVMGLTGSAMQRYVPPPSPPPSSGSSTSTPTASWAKVTEPQRARLGEIFTQAQKNNDYATFNKMLQDLQLTEADLTALFPAITLAMIEEFKKKGQVQFYTGKESEQEIPSGGAKGGVTPFARGGLSSLARAAEMGAAQGGMYNLGGYSDGGRLLRGPGDGVSDSIPATIGNRQPARLADGEFVVPARIVSELGNGSTEAGARKLYAMMDRVQRARSKSVGKGKVAKDTKADKYLPA